MRHVVITGQWRHTHSDTGHCLFQQQFTVSRRLNNLKPQDGDYKWRGAELALPILLRLLILFRPLFYCRNARGSRKESIMERFCSVLRFCYYCNNKRTKSIGIRLFPRLCPVTKHWEILFPRRTKVHDMANRTLHTSYTNKALFWINVHLIVHLIFQRE